MKVGFEWPPLYTTQDYWGKGQWTDTFSCSRQFSVHLYSICACEFYGFLLSYGFLLIFFCRFCFLNRVLILFTLFFLIVFLEVAFKRLCLKFPSFIHSFTNSSVHRQFSGFTPHKSFSPMVWKTSVPRAGEITIKGSGLENKTQICGGPLPISVSPESSGNGGWGQIWETVSFMLFSCQGKNAMRLNTLKALLRQVQKPCFL